MLLLNPVLVDDDAEYKSRMNTQASWVSSLFLVFTKMEGYSPEEDMWVPEADLEHVHEILTQ